MIIKIHGTKINDNHGAALRIEGGDFQAEILSAEILRNGEGIVVRNVPSDLIQQMQTAVAEGATAQDLDKRFSGPLMRYGIDLPKALLSAGADLATLITSIGEIS